MTTALEKFTIEGFQALLFRVQGILFAVDLEHIDELLELHQLEVGGDRLRRFDRLLPFGSAPVIYRDPRILTVHYRGSRLLMQIDQPEDITFIRLENMHPLPALLDRVRETDFIWGVGLVREAPVLLVDCLKIAAACQQDGSLAGNAILNSETHAKT